jgi:Uncharacterized protein conserved in bacteria
MELTNKTLWYDNLRVIATIAVIGIHVSSDYAPSSGTISIYDFWVGNIFDSISRFAVPVFVMLSGALLLSKEYSINVFIKKRVVRLLLPFLFWSLVYIAHTLLKEITEEGKTGFWSMAREGFILLRDGAAVHMWYIYMVIGLYLFIPIIGKWIRSSTEKEITYFLGIWIVAMLLNQPIISKIKPEIDLSYFSDFLGYLVLGYYLKIKSFGSKKQQNIIGLSLIAAGLLITILGTFFVQRYTNKYVSTFYEPLSPNIMLYASGLFIFFKNKDTNIKAVTVVRNFLCKYSYGIYLFHILVLSKLNDYDISWNFINPLIGIPVTVFLCLTISAGVIFLMNKLPFGKYLVG